MKPIHDAACTASCACQLRCVQCGQCIGVYEPVVELIGDVARRTSRAADPQIATPSAARLFHAECYEGPSGGSQQPA